MLYQGPNFSTTTKLGKGNTDAQKRRTRGVGYLRVSTEGQAQEGVSLDAQRIKITAYAQAMEILEDLGVLLDSYFSDGTRSLLSVSDSIDTRSPSGRLVLKVLGSVAQWEREAIVDQTKEALAVLKSQGVRIGHPGDFEDLPAA